MQRNPSKVPANSTDLNPVDYRIWGLIQECFYQAEVRDINDLKKRIVSVWAELKQTIVDKAIDHWQTMLRACIYGKGQHFEHLLN